MEAAQVAAFRLHRHGLAERRARTLAEAAACPASEFQRGSGVLALAARADGVTREAYDRALDEACRLAGIGPLPSRGRGRDAAEHELRSRGWWW